MVAKAAAKKEAPKVEEDSGSPESFTWEPRSGGDPIILPSATAAVPKGKALQFFYQMNKRKGDFVDQIMYAMTAAGVSEAVRDRVFDLGDDETMDLVNAWTAAITGASPGES